MQPEQMFERLLNLGEEWKVTRVKLEGDGIGKEVVIEVEETPALWKRLRCADGGEVFCYDHTEELSWRHLNVFEYRCEIRCRLPRAKSRKTDAVFRVPVPWEGLSKHFTFGFEAAALMLMREMPVRKVGEVLGESDTRLWRMPALGGRSACTPVSPNGNSISPSAKRPRRYCQFSTPRPGTRANSPVLFVTSTAPRRNAWAASIRS